MHLPHGHVAGHKAPHAHPFSHLATKQLAQDQQRLGIGALILDLPVVFIWMIGFAAGSALAIAIGALPLIAIGLIGFLICFLLLVLGGTQLIILGIKQFFGKR